MAMNPKDKASVTSWHLVNRSVIMRGLVVGFSATVCSGILLFACGSRLSPLEQQIVGSWSWNYIEGFGRMIFDANRRVRAGFPPDDKDGRTIADNEFQIVSAGTWRVEGDVLITEMNNKPLLDLIKKLDPANPPPFEAKTERHKIVQIDGNKLVFEDGGSLSRIKRK